MKNVLEWLEESEKKYSNKISFSGPSSDITFHDLLNNAKKIGTYLTNKIDRCEPVAFYMEKSTLTISGMFGAVYAGGFYTLLDLRQPDHRMSQIISVLNPKIILTNQENYQKATELFQSIEVQTIESILETSVIDEDVLNVVRKEMDLSDPLYVNFTSGSTGTPKGVEISHGNVISFIDTFVKTFNIQSTDILGNQAPFDFDVSTKDIYSGISTGATVAIIPRDYFSNPTMLMDYICDEKCTVLIWAVSAMCFVSIMNGFGYRTPSDIRMVMFSGEVMPIKQFNKWKQALPNTKFINLYGPTEITCNCTYYQLDDREYRSDESIPIGKAFENAHVFLLDENDQEITDTNIEGEICVVGRGVGIGYYKDTEKTNTVFVKNPLNPNERMYRTGDLGKCLEDGNLVYTSRKDFQIKHLGHRIELGEIEAQVEKNNQVTRAICLYDNVKKRLQLYYTGSIEEKELVNTLRDVLPPYMIPNKATKVNEMPLTKNGKVDRSKLKELGGKKHVG